MAMVIGVFSVGQAMAAEAEGAEAPVAADTEAASAAGSPLAFDDAVITARRGSERVFDSPFMINTVGSREILERAYRSTPEALRFVPGVMVQKTANGQGSPYIRGFTSFRTLFLIDGVRLNNSTFREGPNQYWATVDPLTVQRYEIVKGPSSVLYGSDAIGGTVNAVTRDPYTYGAGFNAGGRAYYRVSSAENSHTGRGEVSASFDQQTGFLLGGTGRHFGDVIGGQDVGRQPDTGYDEYDVDFKAEHYFNDSTRLVLSHQRVRQNNVPRTHSTVDAVSFHGTTAGSNLQRDLDQERELTYVQLHAENIEDSFIDTLRGSLSWHVQSETEDRIRGGGARTIQGFDNGSLGVWLQAESPTEIGRFTYGVEYYHDNVNSFSTGNSIQGPVADDATYDLLGLYVQDQILFGENDELEIQLGGRFTYAAADADKVRDPVTSSQISVENDWTAFTGSARAVYHLVPDQLNIFGGVSQGFRAPNLSDLTRFDIARSGEQELPAPGLDPEHYIAYEVGIKAQNKDAAVQVSYFYTDISDMIVRVPQDDPATIGVLEVAKVNAGDGHVFGVELGTAWNVTESWSLFGNIAWMEGEIDTFTATTPAVAATEYLSRVQPIITNLGVRYDDPNMPWYVEFTATIADRADKLSSGDVRDTSRIPPGGTPGYAILSLRGGYQVTDQLLLTLGLENLTDEDYRVHGSGSNEPGFNAILGVEMKF
ncbi:TonB-dependent receptor [Planctomycetales bacterium ZRK34]|nr:TonB-dependent receptor [Planctomycetales bacterium ZRK34]